jgi:hypothetical protein
VQRGLIWGLDRVEARLTWCAEDAGYQKYTYVCTVAAGAWKGGVGARVLDYIKIGGVLVGMVVLFHLWVFLLVGYSLSIDNQDG